MALAGAAVVHADTVASLLGNFTVNQFCGLKLAQRSADIHYVVVFGQLPALRELHAADADGNGVTSQAERDAYVARLAPKIADRLELRLDGGTVPLHATHWTSSLPAEQGGFSLRLDIDFTAVLPPPAAGTGSVEFNNRNYPGQMGWREIVVDSAPGTTVFDTNAHDTSVTNALREALQTLPAAGPLDERSVHLRLTQGEAPPGATLLGPRLGAIAPVTPPPTISWLERSTVKLVAAISAPHLEPRVALLALLGALLLGAVHALSPGHGKTIVGAYLIGSRGTPRHAAFLGLTVTVTHTVGVFVLGFATLYASRFIVPERLFPILSLLSALLVLGMGFLLLVRRGRALWQSKRGSPAHSAPPSHAANAIHTATAAHGATPAHAASGRHPASDSFAASADHAASAAHASASRAATSGRVPTGKILEFTPVGRIAEGGRVAHSYILAQQPVLGAHWHSHGGALHSHLPPGADGERVGWRSLLALGISGGIVPCPSAMVLLLAAVALNKTGYGMLLVSSFSAGLALTLTAVGLLFLQARDRFGSPAGAARWTRLLPLASAAAITAVGLVLCFAAAKGFAH